MAKGHNIHDVTDFLWLKAALFACDQRPQDRTDSQLMMDICESIVPDISEVAKVN